MIGLSGYARSGKDTVAKILVENHGFQKIGFADALREVLLRVDPTVDWMLGDDEPFRISDALDEGSWETAKDTRPEVRRLLQQLGVAVRDLVDPDAWVKALTRQLEPGKRYVINDVRFPNELAAVHELGGTTVRIHRPGYGPVNGHVSETALDGAEFDYHIINDGPLAYLRGMVIDLLVRSDSALR